MSREVSVIRWRALAAEGVGTAVLVFMSAGAVLMNYHTLGGVGVLGIALAYGLTVGLVVSCVGHISGGHVNPAVTIALAAAGRLAPREAMSYVGAQLAGGVVGALLLKLCMPATPGMMGAWGAPMLAHEISVIGGVFLELVLTFVWVFAVFATAVDAHGAFKTVAGYGIGTAVAVGALVGGPLTGAAMNPARAFGPAVAANVWAHHWIYWAGPLGGGVLAGWLYQRLFLSGRHKS